MHFYKSHTVFANNVSLLLDTLRVVMGHYRRYTVSDILLHFSTAYSNTESSQTII
jgi:hypothetical protein